MWDPIPHCICIYIYIYSILCIIYICSRTYAIISHHKRESQFFHRTVQWNDHPKILGASFLTSKSVTKTRGTQMELNLLFHQNHQMIPNDSIKITKLYQMSNRKRNSSPREAPPLMFGAGPLTLLWHLLPKFLNPTSTSPVYPQEPITNHLSIPIIGAKIIMFPHFLYAQFFLCCTTIFPSGFNF